MDYQRPATAEDAADLAPRLRALDLREIELSSGNDPLTTLTNAIDISEDTVAIVINDQLSALAGVASGVVWLLCAPEIPQVGSRLIEEGRVWIDAMVEKYGHLHNYVLAEHTEAIQFIELFNFTLTDRALVNGHEFIHFERSHLV